MKKLPFEARQTLKNEVDFYLGKIKGLDTNLNKFSKQLKGEHKEEQGCVLTAYYLSGIYSVLEDIFEKIAKVFENRIENPAIWHKELLLRMRIPINSIRPVVISDKAYQVLDEMRSFRHVFRESYVFSLDAERIELLVKRWRQSKKALLAEISGFIRQVCSL